ncbi:MAG TPA: autotransporter-associated beta strand repeat-containing protein [Bradyrhizobium sp.]
MIVNAIGRSVFNSGTIAGGNGGAGGGGGNPGGGGGGGDGLLSLTFNTTITNSGSITGGKGGSGTAGLAGSSTAGDSGAGINLAGGTGTVFNNTGATIAGGNANGGAAGVGIMTNGLATITNQGTISGGLNNDGVTHAAAIRFGGTNNGLNIAAGSTIIGDIQLITNATATIAAVTTPATLGNNIALGSGSLVTLDTGNQSLSVSGVVSGAGGVVVNVNGAGPVVGTITLSGNNSYSGGTTLTRGTLSVSSDTNLGASSGALTFNGGTLQVTGTTYTGTSRTINWGGGGFDIANAANNFSVSQSLTGNGALTKAGAGTLTLTGSNSYVGGTTIAAGTLQLGNGSTTGSITGDVVNNGVLAVNRSNSYTLGGNISGSGAFVQSGPGTTILTGTNSYGGGTTLAAGILSVSSDTNLGAAAGALTFSGGTLQVTGTTFTGTSRTINWGGGGFDIANAANNFSVSQSLTGNGALTKAGTGTLTLTGSNSYIGGTTISAGTLQLGNGSTTGSITGDVVNNGILAVNRSNTYTLGGNISGSGAFVQSGPGTTILTGTNSYGGGTTLTAGILSVSSDTNLGAAAGALTFSGGTLQVTGTTFTGTSRTINWGGGGFEIADPANNFSVSQLLTGNGALTKSGAGTLIFTGNNSYTGGTTIAAGTLQLGNGGTSGSIGGDVTNNGTLAVNRSDTYTLGGAISGNGVFLQDGPGTTILTGNNSYHGGTTIFAGTLQLGNGGTSGSITGDVINNGILAVNRSDIYTFGGNISGSGAFVQSGSGTTILSGTNSYGGGTTLAAGILSVSSDANLGAAASALSFAGGTLQVTGTTFTGTLRTINWGGGGFDIADAANNFNVSQSLTGNGALTKSGAGTLIFTGNNSYTGGTTIAAGTLQLGNGGTTGSITGDVTNNGTLAVNRAGTYTLSGNISGSGAFAQRGIGATILTGTNTYTGGTTIAQGMLQLGDGGTTGSITGDVVNNGTLAFNRVDAVGFTGAISGTGTVVKLGLGTLTLNGQSTYTGATFVDAGKLVVGDDTHGGASLASTVTVNNGGTLGGIGTVGGITAYTGGIVAPGNSIGTLNVAGNVSFAAGSIYQVEANAAGQSDKIAASGTATLAGGNVLALAQTGTYAPQTVYTILTANGGVSGTFSNVTSSLVFLTPSLSYDANDVFLTLARNNTSLASVADTPNQIAVAGALDASGQQRDPLMIAVLNQSAAGARQAFDALSGEVHASAQTAMLDDSRYLRDAVLGRLRQSSFADSAGPMAALSAGGPQLAAMDSMAASSALAYANTSRPGFPIKAPPLARPAPLPDTTFWAQGVGAWGRLNGDGNAAGMTRDLAGFFSGVDRRFAPNWIAGIAGGYTSSSLRIGDRSSSADIETAHLAGYVGASYGAFNLRGGAGASFSTLDTSRSIIFPGFLDSARARYDATTAQAFGEVGYGVNLGKVAVEPFAGLAWAHLDTDGFAETGGSGAAALRGAGGNQDVGYSSLGARIATSFALTGGMQLTPRASVAWQYAFGDVTPTAALAFQNLGTGFTVAGVPLARNAALVEGGLDLRVTPQASVGIAYVGQLADRVQDHSIKASFSWKF